MSSAGSRSAPIWWSRRRIAIAAVVAVVVGVGAFLFRFNTLGGTLGGFDNDHFTRLIRADMLLQGEQPLRDFADAELRGAWPALTYAMSAWAQQIGGRTLLPEAYLTVGLLTLAFVIVFLLALDLSKRWSVAVLATRRRDRDDAQGAQLSEGAHAHTWHLGPPRGRLEADRPAAWCGSARHRGGSAVSPRLRRVRGDRHRRGARGARRWTVERCRAQRWHLCGLDGALAAPFGNLGAGIRRHSPVP